MTTHQVEHVFVSFRAFSTYHDHSFFVGTRSPFRSLSANRQPSERVSFHPGPSTTPDLPTASFGASTATPTNFPWSRFINAPSLTSSTPQMSVTRSVG